MDLAKHIVQMKSGHFEPKKFEDHYEAALRELIDKKSKGLKIEIHKEKAPAKVISLMDALRRSIAQEKRAPAPPKKGRKRIEGQTEMLLPIAGKKAKEVAAKPEAKPTARQKRAG